MENYILYIYIKEISLIDSLNKELILGNFGYLCSALAIPILEYDVICLHEVSQC